AEHLPIPAPGTNLLEVTRSVTASRFPIFDSVAATVTLSGFTISNGDSPNNRGGGIFDGSTDTVTVTNMTITGNRAGQGNGGGIHIDSAGILNVTNSIISGNSAAGGGGGI